MTTRIPPALLCLAVALTPGLMATAAADEPKPMATAKHPTGLVVEVLSVAVDDTQGKLKVTWRYVNPTKKAIRIVDARGPFVEKNPPDAAYWKVVNVMSGNLDAKAYRHPVLSTKAGDRDATDIRAKGIEVPPDASYEMYARFAKPDPGTKKIHLQVPEVEPFENLDVAWTKRD